MYSFAQQVATDFPIRTKISTDQVRVPREKTVELVRFISVSAVYRRIDGRTVSANPAYSHPPSVVEWGIGIWLLTGTTKTRLQEHTILSVPYTSLRGVRNHRLQKDWQVKLDNFEYYGHRDSLRVSDISEPDEHDKINTAVWACRSGCTRHCSLETLWYLIL